MNSQGHSHNVLSMQHLALGRLRLREQLARLEERRLSFVEQGNGDYYAHLKEKLENELGMCSTLLNGYYLLV